MSAGVLGLLDGRPLPRTELDRRLAELGEGPGAAALPAAGSPEYRQVVRWLAQVVLTEELCAAVATELGLTATASGPLRLDQRAAVELGSITAAAFERSAAVRAVFAAVTAEVAIGPVEVAAYRSATGRGAPAETWRLRTPDGEFEAEPRSLPTALADALRTAPTGEAVTVGDWTAVLLDRRTRTPVDDDPSEHLLDSARRTAFVRWLDRARADRIRPVPGLEHPGDPRQPDNHHRH